MTTAGVAALRAEREALQWWAEPLYDADDFWALPSACPGWSRLDVVAHLTDLFERVVDPKRWPSRDDEVFRSDHEVRRRRGAPAIVVLGDYLAIAGPAIEQLAEMQEPVSGDRLVHFGSLGQHPSHLWADLLVLEHLCHRCFDLGGGTPLYDSLEPAVGAAVSILPQTSSTLAPLFEQPMSIEIGLPVDEALTLWTVGESLAIGRGTGAPVATLHLTPTQFVALVTGRPVGRVSATGDERVVERFLAGIDAF